MDDHTDIVEYLRRNAVFNYKDTYIAAADEIERLRKELDTRIAMCDMRSEKIIELTNERDEAIAFVETIAHDVSVLSTRPAAIIKFTDLVDLINEWGDAARNILDKKDNSNV